MLKVTIICDNCGSSDITSTIKMAHISYGTILDCDTLDKRTIEKSWENIAYCTCKKCGHTFEENLGYDEHKLFPSEIWK